MSIPDRLRPPPVSDDEFAEFAELCEEIEGRLDLGDVPHDLLGRWNRRAGRTYDPAEFATYHGSQDRETFVTLALWGDPPFVADLTYAELRAVLEAELSGELDPADDEYWLAWLEANLPGSGISDLLYWPDQWFGNDELLHLQLSPDQILLYAARASGRAVPGAPEGVEIPYPLPDRKPDAEWRSFP